MGSPIMPSMPMKMATSRLIRICPFSLSGAFIITLFLASGICRAEYKLAVINDPDGYTNLRKGPDTKSDIVLRIEQDELFLCEATKETWWKAKDFFGNQGFIHKSRVFFYKDLKGKDILERGLDRAWLNAVTDQVPIGETGEMVKLQDSNNYFYFDKGSRQFMRWESECDGGHKSEVLFSGEEIPDSLLEDFVGYETPNLRKSLSKLLFESSAPKDVGDTNKGFKTKRGLTLGAGIDAAIKLFGKPHAQMKKDNILILAWTWSYPMDLGNNLSLLEEEDSDWRWCGLFPGWPLPNFSIRMYFKLNKLIGLTYQRNLGGC